MIMVLTEWSIAWRIDHWMILPLDKEIFNVSESWKNNEKKKMHGVTIKYDPDHYIEMTDAFFEEKN